MSSLTPNRPVVARGPAAAPRPARPVSGVTSIDPFRVLRRHAVLIVAAAVIGAVLGAAAYFALGRFHPLYRGTIYYQIHPGLKQSTDLGVNDLLQDQLVFRLANTETMLLMDRGVIRQAVLSPAAQRTSWFRSKFVVIGHLPCHTR